MITATQVLFAMLVTQVPPGKSVFSMEPVAECAGAKACPGARWSSHYGTWVQQESPETARARYRVIVDGLAAETTNALCRDATGAKVESCTPLRGANRWGWWELALTTAAVAIQESGLREDVQVGRGRNGCTSKTARAKRCTPDDAGGMGRGPANERCFMQIHPRELDSNALLGTSETAVRLCFREGIERIVHARWWCAWAKPKVDPLWATVALYGSGNSCLTDNSGKTAKRVNLARRLIWTHGGGR